jgi:basic membrane protein A
MHEFKIYGYFRQSEGAADFKKKLKDLVNKEYDLVVALGFQMRKELASVAEENPDVKFAIVDGYYENPPPTIRSLVFKVDEVGFPAGYLAAAWADLQDPDDPRVAFVGGMQIESVERFTVPFEKGVEYYNKKNDRKVKVQAITPEPFGARPKAKRWRWT